MMKVFGGRALGLRRHFRPPLGPWQAHPDAPAWSGGDSYLTGFSSYVRLKAGAAASHPRLEKTWAWLKASQDSSTGAWPAVSMNKSYPKGSMQESFQQDAATAFAVLALVEAGR